MGKNPIRFIEKVNAIANSYFTDKKRTMKKIKKF